MRKKQKDQRCVKMYLSAHGDLVLKPVAYNFRSFWHRSRSLPLGIGAPGKLKLVWTNRKRCSTISFLLLEFNIVNLSMQIETENDTSVRCIVPEVNTCFK